MSAFTFKTPKNLLNLYIQAIHPHVMLCGADAIHYISPWRLDSVTEKQEYKEILTREDLWLLIRICYKAFRISQSAEDNPGAELNPPEVEQALPSR